MNPRRRLLLAGLSTLAMPAQGQTKRKVTIALLLAGGSTEDDASGEFVTEMRRRGWVEGENVIYQRLYARGSRERADELAREAVKTRPDLIYTSTGGGVSAARKASSTIPIVFIMVSDPVASGYVASLRQPGQNATGVFQMGADIISKRLELAHEALPHARRIGVLLDSRATDYSYQKRSHEESPKPKGVSIATVEVSTFPEAAGALDHLKKNGASAFILAPSFTLTSRKADLIRLALEREMAPIAYRLDWAQAGALLTYGADIGEVHRQSAEMADRILNGSRPSDTPVERASKFELIVNLRTAKALGLTLPKLVLQRADRVIK